MLNLIRNLLGNLIIFFDWLFSPKRKKRGETEQAEVDEQTRNLALYQFRACPFCIKTRRGLKRLNLNIELRDASGDPQARSELQQGGGKIKVPCLRIQESGDQVTWMYESSAILDYLEQRFG